MFDATVIPEFLRADGLVQSFLLAMIWLSSRGIKIELRALHVAIADLKQNYDKRFESLEGRIGTIEQTQKQGA